MTLPRKTLDMCFKCHHDIEHPFHDDGTVNPKQDTLWHMGEKHGVPDFHGEDRKADDDV